MRLSGKPMKAKKLSRSDARQVAIHFGIDFKKDYHQLSVRDVDRLLIIRRLNGYRKPRTASGSTGRYFFQYLQRAK